MTTEDKRFAPYVTRDPEILGGSPVLRHTRVRLETVLQCYMEGAKPEEIAEWYLIDDLDALRQIKGLVDAELAASH